MMKLWSHLLLNAQLHERAASDGDLKARIESGKIAELQADEDENEAK